MLTEVVLKSKGFLFPINNTLDFFLNSTKVFEQKTTPCLELPQLDIEIGKLSERLNLEVFPMNLLMQQLSHYLKHLMIL